MGNISCCVAKAYPNPWIWRENQRWALIGLSYSEIRFLNKNKVNYFFICACQVIFFDFLQSDWLQQRAAFYDILTADRGPKVLFF